MPEIIVPQEGGGYFNSTAYEFDFFSGSQIGVYIGDVLVDDILQIQFEVSQGKRPVYGYSSQYFHSMAAGQVLVQGSFAINFKESGYLLPTLNRYQERMAPIKGEFAWDEGAVRWRADAGSKAADQGIVIGENIERILERQAAQEEATPSGKYQPTGSVVDTYRGLAALSDEKFEDIAEGFEDALWKQENINAESNSGNIVPGKPGNIYEHRRADQYPAFDIWVLYGDVNNAAANHTIKKIIDCHIIGQAQTITVGGEPILEQYQFLARNLI